MVSPFDIVKSAKRPRAPLVDYPSDHTAGKPGDLTVIQALELFASVDQPGTIVDLGKSWGTAPDWKAKVMKAKVMDYDGVDRYGKRDEAPRYERPEDKALAVSISNRAPAWCLLVADQRSCLNSALRLGMCHSVSLLVGGSINYLVGVLQVLRAAPGQPETLTVFSQHRHELRNRPSSVKFGVGDAIVPRPTVMLQRSGFSRRARSSRTTTRMIRRRVLFLCPQSAGAQKLALVCQMYDGSRADWLLAPTETEAAKTKNVTSKKRMSGRIAVQVVARPARMGPWGVRFPIFSTHLQAFWSSHPICCPSSAGQILADLMRLRRKQKPTDCKG